MSKKGITEPIDYLERPIKRVASNDLSVGVLLFLSAAAALVIANSSWGSHWYHHLWETSIKISFGEAHFGMNLHHLINDGLMALFFFQVGLEIKREFILGRLNTLKKASLPVGAAIGGDVSSGLDIFSF